MHAVKVTIQPRLLHPRLRLLVAEEEGLLLLSQVYRSLGQMSTRKSGRPPPMLGEMQMEGIWRLDMSLLERLAKIETQVDALVQSVQELKEKLDVMTPDVVSALDSTKSAHHRIDEFKRDVCWTIGMSTTLVGIFASVLTWALGR